jgi:uncharacterized protein YndB with AHSA1/START domain
MTNMENVILKTAVIFDAPASIVWRGLTDPAIVKQYFYGTNLESDFKLGSRITFSGEWDGKTYTDGGIILAIEPPFLLKYSYWSSMSGTEDIPENYADITYELIEDDGKTTLQITQDGIKNQEDVAQHEQNWVNVFDGLKKLL